VAKRRQREREAKRACLDERYARPVRPTTGAFSVFSGDNGQGKTTLLEAIFAVAALRSFRTAKLADVIAFGAERASLGARVRKDDLARVTTSRSRRAPGARRSSAGGARRSAACAAVLSTAPGALQCSQQRRGALQSSQWEAASAHAAQ
jgi:ABC-type molybdenum transport system ATPase subunit/photorepair protein PhrA